MNEVAQILSAIESGQPQEAERLLPLVFHELRRLAAQRPAAPGSTPTTPTFLVRHAGFPGDGAVRAGEPLSPCGRRSTRP